MPSNVPRLVERQQVKTVSEDLLPLQKAKRADDDIARVSAMTDSAGADCYVGLAFAILEALPPEIRAMLGRDHCTPVHANFGCC